jgi:methyltransferase-like protein/2-polyprenyl-3-methyl-5-hydroxy-6-metoxy-1,4-benzoquinol methylase
VNRPRPINAVHGAIARNAASYDDLPYASHPFPQTQPARLAALAHLFSLAPPPTRTARVLEVGCASGGNLIPLAARSPEGAFLGIDLSQRQIDEGKARIARLGLRNIRLRQLSLTDLRPKDGTFDYIICHGVYSWVPEPVRRAMLRMARNNLAPTGIAFISYNVLPGWRLRQTLRDALALHVPMQGGLQQRLKHARELLAFLRDHTPLETTWGRIFRAEAAQLATMSDSYLGHEFLEDCNEPCSFSEFIGDAGAQDLGYLAEAELVTMLPENMNPSAAPLLRALAGNQLVPLEQHIDIFTGRTFRQTLLVHKEREAQCVRTLLPTRVEGLHFTGPADFVSAGAQDGQAVFKTIAGARFTTGDKTTRAAIETLIARLPGSSSVEELATAIGARGIAHEQTRANVADALFKMMMVGILQPSSEPVRAAASLTKNPIASPLLRRDLEAGQTSSANLHHQHVDFDIVNQIVVPRLDGTSDRDALIGVLREAEAAGRVTFMRDGQKITDAEALAASAAEHVDRSLSDCLRNACLVG